MITSKEMMRGIFSIVVIALLIIFILCFSIGLYQYAVNGSIAGLVCVIVSTIPVILSIGIEIVLCVNELREGDNDNK